MTTDRYTLEIYEVGSDRDVLEVLHSDSPFMAIAKGDWFNSTETMKLGGMGQFRVRGVEHIIWPGNGSMKHKLCVYVEEVKDRTRTP